ncbi:MAG: carboxypeptidase regulatory-like domain-containing protein [Flavobacteriales bacterium]|nr:carboxypeptidase regulatory-like domain-containing protein [Flavobacteriales bacterium]
MSQVFAQGGYMTIRGKVVLNDKGLPGVKVILLKNGSKENEALTSSSGKYTFNDLNITPDGDIYIVKISKPGHISVKHWVSTKAPDDRETIFPDYFPEVELFKMVKEVEKEQALAAILDKPISKFGYSVSKGDFSDDRAYFSTIKARVNQLFEILDAEDRERKRLLAAYRLKQLQEASESEEEVEVEEVKSSFEIRYDEAMDRADKSFERKKYRKAKGEYRKVMTLIAKSGLKKSERDKLKKYPKRKIYDLETLTAGLSDEEIDSLENDVEEVVAEEGFAEEEAEEREEEVLKVEEEVAEEEVVEEEVISEEEQAKAEAEKAMPNAMQARDLMLKENKEEIARKRKENNEKATVQTMSSNVEVKEHEVAMSVARKASEAKINRNKEVVAQRNLAMMTMIANANRKSKPVVKKAIPSESREIRPGIKPITSTSAADKDKKDLDRSVVIVHNRIKVTASKQKPNTTSRKKPVAKARVFNPKSVRYTEESLYKTVTNTIITFPIRQDTLRQVDYRWGTSYYYRNAEEIDVTTYNKLLEILR